MAQALEQPIGETIGGMPEAAVERPTREGSPWTGLWAVVGKDMADHLTSVRMLILMLLIVLTAVGTVWGALQEIRSAAPEIRSCFCGCLRRRTIRCRRLWAF